MRLLERNSSIDQLSLLSYNASMITSSVHYAKTHLSKLLAKVAEGERVVITNRGKPVAELKTPRDIQPLAALLGSMEGGVHYLDDWDEADKEVLELFEESLNKPL